MGCSLQRQVEGVMKAGVCMLVLTASVAVGKPVRPVSASGVRPTGYGRSRESARVVVQPGQYGGMQEMSEVGGEIAAVPGLPEVSGVDGTVVGVRPAGGINPISFWRFHALRRPEDSAAWDNELRGRDVPNEFEQLAFPGAKDLKLVALAGWSMQPPSDTNAVRLNVRRGNRSPIVSARVVVCPDTVRATFFARIVPRSVSTPLIEPSEPLSKLFTVVFWWISTPRSSAPRA